jgi:peptidyl-tRNA hydrolase, PTH1 family
MKLIVGLGNPGSDYARTRHSAGFLAVDRLLARHGAGLARQKFSGELHDVVIAGERTLVLRPMRFMNCSGVSVAEAVGFHKINPAEDLLVLVDDYALALGQLRLRGEGSAGGHNGLSDIQRALGTTVYPRLRIGIDPPPATYGDPADWVLGRFTDEQLAALSPALDQVVSAVGVFVSEGLTTAMNRFNGRGPQQAARPPKPRPQGGAGGAFGPGQTAPGSGSADAAGG